MLVEAGSCDDVTATNLLLGLGTSGHWAQAGGCTPGGCCDHRTSATPLQGVLELTMKFRDFFSQFLNIGSLLINDGGLVSKDP